MNHCPLPPLPHPTAGPDQATEFPYLRNKKWGGGCLRSGYRGLKDIVFIYLSPAEKQKAFSLAILKTDFLGDTLV